MPTLVKLTDSEKARLLQYLEDEHDRALRDVYEPLQAKRNSWEDKYIGKVKPRRASWMSNIPPQLGATYVDATTARFLNTLSAYRPTFTVQALRESDWTKVAKSVEAMMEFKVQQEMQYYDVMRRVLFEVCRLGSGAFLAPWVEEFEQVQGKKYGFIPTTTQVPMIQGIVCKGLPLRDLIIPGGYAEVEELPWWSRKLHWTPLVLEMARADKFYDSADIDKLLRHQTQPDPAKEAAQQRAGEETPTTQVVNGIETWLHYDIKKGAFGRFVVKWHPDSRTILKVEVDEYPRWPLFLFRYGPRDYGIFGLGIMEMSDAYEDALYAMTNLLIDNFKIATLQCFKGKKGTGLRSDTELYPGKLFLLNDPEKDLLPMAMGQAFVLNPAFTRMIMEFGERRTGISDYGLGRESPTVGSKATATATLALIQEGQRRFDLCIRDVRSVLDRFGNYVLRMNHANLPSKVPYMILGDTRGAYVGQWLDMPVAPPYFSIALVSNLSNLTMNKEVAKTDATTTMGLMSQYYQQMVQLKMMISNPQTPPDLKSMVEKIMTAASEKFRSVLEVYGEPSPERYSDIFLTGVPPSPDESLLGGAPASIPPGVGAPPPSNQGLPFMPPAAAEGPMNESAI